MDTTSSSQRPCDDATVRTRDGGSAGEGARAADRPGPLPDESDPEWNIVRGED